MDNILTDIKKVLGIHEAVDEFDLDLIMHINSAFFQLNQIGIGPPEGFVIQDGSAVWEEFIAERVDLAAVKSYVTIIVRLLFDRPETSYGIQALERMKKEWEWRLEIQAREGKE